MSLLPRFNLPFPTWAALRNGPRQRFLGDYSVTFVDGLAGSDLPSPFVGRQDHAAGFGALDAARTAVSVGMLERPELFGLPLAVRLDVVAPWALFCLRPVWRCLVTYDHVLCPRRPPGQPHIVLYVLREALSCDVAGTSWSFVLPSLRRVPAAPAPRSSPRARTRA